MENIGISYEAEHQFHIMFPVGFFTLPAGIIYLTRRNGQFCHGTEVIHAFDVHAAIWKLAY
ncbi:hypothetical protein P9246_10225 [Aeribacillus pallidus]|uniref:hypothetical protein n=1 Tax=Aeribacillus TaxID=1055323 RepID=UPI001059362A|nr:MULTISPECIES: hypothetical protein [Aeribacillus]MED0649448.1 hypothetical protein [Aeribacillus composti]MED4487129.1 hypothetical protein [Aeribacillus pallidus]